jgi:hypothetical protein
MKAKTQSFMPPPEQQIAEWDYYASKPLGCVWMVRASHQLYKNFFYKLLPLMEPGLGDTLEKLAAGMPLYVGGPQANYGSLHPNYVMVLLMGSPPLNPRNLIKLSKQGDLTQLSRRLVINLQELLPHGGHIGFEEIGHDEIA